MCLILFAYQQHPQFPLIIAANRDEFFERPTQTAHFWQDAPDLLAGRDLQAGGTWMGVTKTGRFAAVTNFREPRNAPVDAKSRGLLCTDYLLSKIELSDYLRNIRAERERFAGFNLLLGDFSEPENPRLAYYSNRSGCEPSLLQAGVHGVSNGLLNDSWPKVDGGKSELAANLGAAPEQLMHILSDDATADPARLPDTGIDKDKEQQLSARFIRMEGYGTRCSTILRFSSNGQVEWLEQVFEDAGKAGERQLISFELQN